MKVTARPTGEKGMVELLVDGKRVEGVRCVPGSARISKGQIEFRANVQCAPYMDKERKTDENNSQHQR